MLTPTPITSEYFRNYRRQLGFTNQGDVKDFFGGKDITPTIDFNYLTLLNIRLCEVVDRLNSIVNDEIKIITIKSFKNEFIDRTFDIMKKNDILPHLNNLGRRPEQVYYSWMRGYVISNFFLKALSLVFEVELSKIILIGDDNLKNPETFKKAPTADLEVELIGGDKIRIEMQSGFTGINDVKQHKVMEAKRVFNDLGLHTLVIHFDLYNGQVAFLKVDEISDNDINWITRQQMEGQTVFNIDQNYFIWKLTEKPILFKDMTFS